MGLFSSKSTSQNTVINETSNVVNDGRIGVADDANALIGGDGAVILQTLNNVTQIVDPATLTALSVSIDGGLDAITAMTGKLISGVADAQATAREMARDSHDAVRDLFDRASGITSDALAANDRAVNYALASGERSLAESFGFGRDALDFAKLTQTQLADLFDTFGDRLEHDADENRVYSSALVGSVLQQARTSDERNIQEFLTAAKWIVGFVVVAFVAPKVFAK